MSDRQNSLVSPAAAGAAHGPAVKSRPPARSPAPQIDAFVGFNIEPDVPSSAMAPSAISQVQDALADWVEDRRREGPSWIGSLLFHVLILALLGLITFGNRHNTDVFGTVLSRGEPGSETGRIDGTDIGLENLVAPLAGGGPDGGDVVASVPQPEQAGLAQMELGLPSAGPAIEPDDDGEPTAPADASPAKGGAAARAAPRKAGKGAGTGVGKEQGANVAGILNGRDPDARAKLVKKAGGTKESEAAVNLGLEWLARHQQSDGSWSFQHGPDDPGTAVCPTGATGLALLAFLGAGHTHKKGDYKSHVTMGLKYLTDHMEVTKNGGWMQGTGLATMYAQGICAIALCEAYTMTKDQSLRSPAQLAITFIVKAQDPEGGGWRYRIPQAGDTSVHGWQLMALQSARIAELDTPQLVFVKATRFLKSVESEGGALYGYTSTYNIRPSTTAVGLLCRMYLGREPTHRGLTRGIKYLSDWGPNIDDMYYSYYATQALHHWGDDRWEKWNAVMRDQLVLSQAQIGDAAGSWRTDSSFHSDAGGRLYTTCLSILTLEVYYRYLPIYRKQNILEDL